jgi:ABC-type glycerol-3-phosphate transport system substrate-binding protein
MNRLILILAAFALLAAACSGNESSTEAKAAPEEAAAPDFTLALEPSGEFVLSQEVKPVYMVFWAEW